MSIAYSAQFYDKDGQAKAIYSIQAPQITYDYLTLETTKIYCVANNIIIGDLVVINTQDNIKVYCGIVENILITADNNTEITLKPIESILYANTSYLYEHQNEAQTGAFDCAEAEILNMSRDIITPVNFSAYGRTNTKLVIPTQDNIINNAWNYITYCLEKEGITAQIEPTIASNGYLSFNLAVGKISNTCVIELSQSYVLDYEINEGSSKKYNTCRIVQCDNSGIVGKVVYHVNSITGEVSTSESYALEPYIATEVSINSTDATECFNKAQEILSGGRWVNEIRATIANDNLIINPNTLPIGTIATLMLDNIAYESILTGYIKEELTTTLIFGTIRSELTKQMAIDSITTGSGTISGQGGTSSGVQDVKVNGASVVSSQIANVSVNQYDTTQEVIIGTYNGKPLYRKTFHKGAISSGSSTMTAPLDNPQTIVNVQGWGNEGTIASSAQFTLPYHNPSDTRYSVGVFWRNGSLNFRSGSGGAVRDSYIWVDYIKTTD